MDHHFAVSGPPLNTFEPGLFRAEAGGRWPAAGGGVLQPWMLNALTVNPDHHPLGSCLSSNEVPIRAISFGGRRQWGCPAS